MIPIRVIHAGDVYCPRCGSWSVAMDITFENHFWFCDQCNHRWDWNHDGVDWIWPEGAKPTPGCPFCGTQNITGHALPLDLAQWRCNRQMCGKTWVGKWTQYADGRRRWTIRIAARDVPFIDLDTWRADGGHGIFCTPSRCYCDL